ncbi:MAG: IS110 family transposase, partial [Proteobacteria bacterium]|nr:IS110 family transposase [Pseudomonadota bacterium]
MKATQMPQIDDNRTTRTLYMAFELGKSSWLLAFFDGRKKRQIQIAARDQKALAKQIDSAIEKLGLTRDTPIISCYEAGRDGFWLHRVLVKKGICNMVVDSSSIEVNRKARRSKTDKLDADSLVRMLYRYVNGEEKVWSVLRIPHPKIEDDRRIHRELGRLKKERSAHTIRIKTLLFGQGVVVNTIATTPGWLETLRTGDGRALEKQLLKEIIRELARLKLVREQIKEMETDQKVALKERRTIAIKKVRKLMQLKGIGLVSSWNLIYEFFWRNFSNRKQVASAAGLTPSVYQSGVMDRDLGISKAGNKRIRSLMVELSWLWLRYQPESELSQWFTNRFGTGSRRIRKVGIVAMARKLLVALWKYLEADVIP